MSDDFRNASSRLFVKLRKYHYQERLGGGGKLCIHCRSIRQKWRGKNCTFHSAVRNHILSECYTTPAPSMFTFFLLVVLFVMVFVFGGSSGWRHGEKLLWHNDYVAINTRNTPRGPTPVATRPSRGQSDSNRSCDVFARIYQQLLQWKHAYGGFAITAAQEGGDSRLSNFIT